MTTVKIEKPTDLLQFVDNIRHDFFDQGMAKGLKTRVTFFVENGPESVVTNMLNKPVSDHIHHMNTNVGQALDEAINEIRRQGGLVFEDTEIVLSAELAEQDE